jgi:hypothetical protein
MLPNLHHYASEIGPMLILLFLALSIWITPVAPQTTVSASWGYYRIGQIDQTTTSDANAWNTVVVDAGHVWPERVKRSVAVPWTMRLDLMR